MSRDTRAALEAAVAAHFADELNGAWVTESYVIAYGENPGTGDRHYLRSWPHGQSPHHTGGLIDYAMQQHHNTQSTRRNE